MGPAASYDYPLVPPLGNSQASPAAQAKASAPEQAASPAQQTQVQETGVERPVEQSQAPDQAQNPPADENPSQSGPKEEQTGSGASAGQMAARALTEEEQAKLQDLKKRDREVKAHEQAHMAAGGRYVRGGAHYEYEKGPDGKQYAVGGEVSIDASEESSPEASIRKAQTVKKAALAPAKPSSQDRQVAAQASQMEREAKAELRSQRQEEAELAAQDQAQKSGSGQGAFSQPTGQNAPPPISVRLRPLNTVV